MHDPSSSEILEAIEGLARRRFGWDGALEETTRLVEDLALDSLKALEMLVEVENLFRVRIDEAAEREIVTVGDLLEVVEARIQAREEEAR